ncbi:adenosine deaminase [Streptomyces lunaelactis]|uniref:adenosine deaminase n=1 Tax=Streptomyces lunaelactis TaxID=1535768 RepID=A0A2R4SWW7_9ACTN|nr:adenosine deaminase [Streptomyces lunaelactis]AVZ71334.1 adenosine deaminase [Streptomyces lunaelactis]NUK83985.1 adenosine deaminase [Streptomyces lunaelactis]
MINNSRSTARNRRTVVIALGLALLTAPAAAAADTGAPPAPTTAPAPAPAPGPATEHRVSAFLDSIRDRPQDLAAFFRQLPKGGDLHSHLAGAASTELLMDLAVTDGLCIENGTQRALAPPCPANSRPAADLRTDAEFRQQVLRAWSMQDFTPGEESGHDHFFATFGKFGEASWRHPGKLMAEVANTVARQNQFYQELMITPNSPGANALADRVGYDANLPRMRQKLLADGAMDQVVRQARTDADQGLAEFRATARCDSAKPDPGCAVPFRFISQVSRNSAPERVFTQMVVAMELAERDPRFVAVNLVQPEDGAVSLRDYSLHMRMLGHLHRVYPRAHITLHAGELAPGLVKPEDLRFHIAEAVNVAHAERIGHGVDIRHEDGADGLLRSMAERRVAVEVPLSSNDQILGVSGPEHPFPLYRQRGVPVVLATDDAGVSRITISDEYRRAATTYDLSYRELKDLARASLEYAFLPGRSLWRTPDGYRPVLECLAERPGKREPGRLCAAFLAANEKAVVEWRQEAAFTAFEQRVLASARGQARS